MSQDKLIIQTIRLWGYNILFFMLVSIYLMIGYLAFDIFLIRITCLSVLGILFVYFFLRSQQVYKEIVRDGMK